MTLPLNVLVACECSGAVRDAFRKLGHNAWSCDLKPDEGGSEFHAQGDALDLIQGRLAICHRDAPIKWDLIIMHPPCTFLSVSGMHWNSRIPGRSALTADALAFVKALIRAAGDTPFCIENPMSIISTKIRPKDQSIQPYMFGHDASKTTWLWLSRLPKLVVPDHDTWVSPRWVCACGEVYRADDEEKREAYRARAGKHEGRVCCCRCVKPMLPRWSNQTDSGQNRLGPSEARATDRARTYAGIATAMAEQWSEFLCK